MSIGSWTQRNSYQGCSNRGWFGQLLVSWPDLLATSFAVVSADWGRCHQNDDGDDVITNQVWADCLLAWFSSNGCCDSGAKVAT